MEDLIQDIETPTKLEEPKKMIPVVEEVPQTVNEDELIDKNGEFIIFADSQESKP